MGYGPNQSGLLTLYCNTQHVRSKWILCNYSKHLNASNLNIFVNLPSFFLKTTILQSFAEFNQSAFSGENPKTWSKTQTQTTCKLQASNINQKDTNKPYIQKVQIWHSTGNVNPPAAMYLCFIYNCFVLVLQCFFTHKIQSLKLVCFTVCNLQFYSG